MKLGRAAIWYEPGDLIPTDLVECCQEWEVPMGYQYGRCGLCGERPRYIGPQPREKWPMVPYPKREGN